MAINRMARTSQYPELAKTLAGGRGGFTPATRMPTTPFGDQRKIDPGFGRPMPMPAAPVPPSQAPNFQKQVSSPDFSRPIGQEAGFTFGVNGPVPPRFFGAGGFDAHKEGRQAYQQNNMAPSEPYGGGAGAAQGPLTPNPMEERLRAPGNAELLRESMRQQLQARPEAPRPMAPQPAEAAAPSAPVEQMPMADTRMDDRRRKIQGTINKMEAQGRGGDEIALMRQKLDAQRSKIQKARR
jgi:hypothetical protein